MVGSEIANLQILFPMENDALGFHFPVFDVHLVATQHDGDVVAHSHQISVPVRHILVRHSCSHVKHDNGTLPLDVVAVPESSKLLLTSCVPHIEPDGPTVCVEDKRVNLHTQSGCRERERERRGREGGGEMEREGGRERGIATV